MNRGNGWKIQSLKCLERDNHLCRKCGRLARSSHHIIPFRISRDNSIRNLISLCKSCHAKEENQYRRIGITNYVRNMIAENVLMENLK